MTRPLSISRIVALAIAAGLVFVTVHSVIAWRRLDREFLEWIDARPTRMSVDLSRPCRITGPFKQTCSTSHGEALYLTLQSDYGATPDPGMLDGLEGTIAITDLDGDAWLKTDGCMPAVCPLV